MKNIYGKIKDTGFDKAAFLLLLFATVLAAGILVNVRGKIELSAPVKLTGSGLSVSLPAGKLWQSETEWKHSGQSYIIKTTRYNQASKTATVVMFICHLANYQESPGEFLKDKYDESNISDSGDFDASGKTFSWVEFGISEPFLTRQRQVKYQNIYRVIALGNLSPTRQLEVRVESLESGETAKRIFDAIKDGIFYRDNQELDRGLDFTATFIDSGGIKNSMLDELNFVVTDNTARPAGFYMEKSLFGDYGQKRMMSVASFEYVQAINAYTKTEELTFSDDLKSFGIKSKFELQRNIRPEVYDIDYNQPTLQYRDVSSGDSVSISTPIAPMPEFFAYGMAKYFLQNGYEPVIVDVIDSKGQIVPMRLEKKANPDGTDDIVEFQSLNNEKTVSQLYLDSEGRLVKIKNLSNGYESRISTKSEIEKLFPMWYELIRNYNLKNQI